MQRIALAAIVGAFALTACGSKDEKASGDKCTKAVNHTMSLSMDMVKGMAEAMGDKSKEIIAKAEKDIKEKTPEAIKKCGERLKADPKIEKTLDCLLASANQHLLDITWLDRCPGLDPIRDDPGFAHARMVVQRRVAGLWPRGLEAP